jgi:hypothetical protein
MHLWTISASVTGENKATVIAYFESIVRQMKDNNYAQSSGGGGTDMTNGSWSVEGPVTKPLNDDEIAKLRNLIGG